MSQAKKGYLPQQAPEKGDWMARLDAMGLRLPEALRERPPTFYAIAINEFTEEHLPLFHPDRDYLQFAPGALLAVYRTSSSPRDVSRTWFKGVVVPSEALAGAGGSGDLPAGYGPAGSAGAAGSREPKGLRELTYGWFPSTYVITEVQALSRRVVYGGPYELLLESEGRCYPRFLELIGRYLVDNDLLDKPGAFRISNAHEKQSILEQLLAQRRGYTVEDLLDKDTAPEIHFPRMFKKFLCDMQDPIIPLALWRSFAYKVDQVIGDKNLDRGRKVDLFTQFLVFYLPMSRLILLRKFMELASRLKTGDQEAMSSTSLSDMFGMYLINYKLVQSESIQGGQESYASNARIFLIENWRSIEERISGYYGCAIPPLDRPLAEIRFSHAFHPKAERREEEIICDFGVERGPSPVYQDASVVEVLSTPVRRGHVRGGSSGHLGGSCDGSFRGRLAAGSPAGGSAESRPFRASVGPDPQSATKGSTRAGGGALDLSKLLIPPFLMEEYPGVPSLPPPRQPGTADPVCLRVRQGDKVDLLTISEGWALVETRVGKAARRGWVPFSCLARSRELVPAGARSRKREAEPA